jgi:L-threonylcarbamoyladenylate synthase
MITTNINQAIEALNKGEVIAIPTETVYGLAANAFDEAAIKKIFTLKNRPFYNPLIVHIKSGKYLNTIADDIPEIAFEMAKHFWPGPLTLILKKQKHISDFITAAKDTVAIRVPNHGMALQLLKKLEFPLAAPSANPFGSISSTSANHVFNYFKNELKVILDGGICEKGVESTIVGFEGNQLILYRHGAVSIEAIEAKFGKVILATSNNKTPSAPGMLSRHYAPSTPTYFTDNVALLLKKFEGKKIGLLLFNKAINTDSNIVQEVLSENSDLNEAAKVLYAALHRLDQRNLDLIIAEKFPNEALGKTINDRLKRAIKK